MRKILFGSFFATIVIATLFIYRLCFADEVKIHDVERVLDTAEDDGSSYTYFLAECSTGYYLKKIDDRNNIILNKKLPARDHFRKVQYTEIAVLDGDIYVLGHINSKNEIYYYAIGYDTDFGYKEKIVGNTVKYEHSVELFLDSDKTEDMLYIVCLADNKEMNISRYFKKTGSAPTIEKQYFSEEFEISNIEFTSYGMFLLGNHGDLYSISDTGILTGYSISDDYTPFNLGAYYTSVTYGEIKKNIKAICFQDVKNGRYCCILPEYNEEKNTFYCISDNVDIRVIVSADQNINIDEGITFKNLRNADCLDNGNVIGAQFDTSGEEIFYIYNGKNAAIALLPNRYMPYQIALITLLTILVTYGALVGILTLYFRFICTRTFIVKRTLQSIFFILLLAYPVYVGISAFTYGIMEKGATVVLNAYVSMLENTVDWENASDKTDETEKLVKGLDVSRDPAGNEEYKWYGKIFGNTVFDAERDFFAEVAAVKNDVFYYVYSDEYMLANAEYVLPYSIYKHVTALNAFKGIIAVEEYKGREYIQLCRVINNKNNGKVGFIRAGIANEAVRSRSSVVAGVLTACVILIISALCVFFINSMIKVKERATRN